jgi:hypothetical protein
MEVGTARFIDHSSFARIYAMHDQTLLHAYYRVSNEPARSTDGPSRR